MRFTLSAVSVLYVVLCLTTVSAMASESGEFVKWALRQGEACDSSWDDFVKAQPDGVGVRGSAIRSTTSRSFTSTGTGTRMNNKGFIHKANHRFLPFSATRRSDPSRGAGKLQSPASARLNVPHSRQRPSRSRMDLGRSIRRRRSGSTRLSVTSSHRISSSSRRRRSASRTGHVGGRRGW